MKTLTEAEEIAESVRRAGNRAKPAEDRNVSEAGDFAAKLAASLEVMIANAPDGAGTGSDDCNRRRLCLVRESNGWGSAYVEEDELTGASWLQTFRDAKAAIAARGIVAFIGTRGGGKTRMAAEIARAGYWPDDKGEWNGNAVVAGKTALYRRAMDVFLDLRAAAKNDSKTSEKAVMEQLEKPGLLIIDEFQERGESEWENRILTNLLDKRYAANRPTLIIANYDAAALSQALSPSVKDRMRENGRAFKFTWNSYRQPQP